MNITPTLPLPVELTDEEILRVPIDNVRHNLLNLLRERRVRGADYIDLEHIAAGVNEQIAKLQADPDTRLDHHIATKNTLRRWQNLEMVVKEQMQRMRNAVKVDKDEEDALIVRWLRLKFLSAPVVEREVEGVHFVGGIMQVGNGMRVERRR